MKTDKSYQCGVSDCDHVACILRRP